MNETEIPLQMYKEKINNRDDSEENEQEQPLDPFTALMFGGRKNALPQFELFPDRQPLQNLPSNQTNIDLEALMHHIDTLVESVNGLKPLLKKAYPYIQKVLNKK
ncbi:hypothetical protein [Neobacillus muris]|uniref:hypothetical protein n=1 Tax=Neobacillus muris TaxID=2941334 RepID=UPI00203CCA28|nr:hypothetical protein [Neobacillus muris]